MKWLKSTYQSIVDHLTKALGVIGVAIMSAFTGLIGIDPEAVRNAAQTYLGEHAAAKIGTALFVLVILRGWYTGVKANKTNTPLPAPDPKSVRAN